MRVFFDISVLVAASVASHPQHPQARASLQRAIDGKDAAFMSTHSIAEVFAALTRLPVIPRIHPSVAVRLVTTNLLPHVEAIPLGRADYLEVLKVVDQGEWVGAKIYDTLLLRCAEKAEVQRIYTFNLVDVRALASASSQPKICAPS